MKLTTRVGVFVTVGLLALLPVSAAHATGGPSPNPAPSTAPTATAAPSSAAQAMQCTAQDATEGPVVIEFDPPSEAEEISVTVDGQQVETQSPEPNTVAVPRSETRQRVSIKLWDADAQPIAHCQITIEPSSPTPEPPPPDSPSPAPDDTETPTPTPEPTETPVTAEPSTPVTQPNPSTQPPSSPSQQPSFSPPQQSPLPSAPTVPYRTQDASPAPAPPADTPESTGTPTTSSQPGTRHFRPLAESPRYLLPQLLGIEPHRGSPLIMPQPRASGEHPAELETLPPVSEDELAAIKAELSSPGRADTVVTDNEIRAAAPAEQGSDRSSWWVLLGVTALVVVVSVVGWWATSRRKRRH